MAPSKRNPLCARCRHHGLLTVIKGHKRTCPFKNCPCSKCLILRQKQNIMAKQVALRRKQKIGLNYSSLDESSSNEDILSDNFEFDDKSISPSFDRFTRESLDNSKNMKIVSKHDSLNGSQMMFETDKIYQNENILKSIANKNSAKDLNFDNSVLGFDNNQNRWRRSVCVLKKIFTKKSPFFIEGILNESNGDLLISIEKILSIEDKISNLTNSQQINKNQLNLSTQANTNPSNVYWESCLNPCLDNSQNVNQSSNPYFNDTNILKYQNITYTKPELLNLINSTITNYPTTLYEKNTLPSTCTLRHIDF